MNLLTKLTTAKTSTLVVFTFILSAWMCLVPLISFAINDLTNWLLSSAALSGPYRFADKQLFDLLENAYRAWWGVGVSFFVVLTAVQLLVIVPLAFYLSHVLYKRYKAGTAKFWQIWLPVSVVILAVVFILTTLYIAYADVKSWKANSGQVDVVNDAGVLENVPEWTSFS